MSRFPRHRSGVIFAGAFVALVLAGLTLAIPTGPARPDQGRIVSVERVWRGGHVARFVSVGTGDLTKAPLPGRHDCRAGDTITVTRWPRVVGTGVKLAGDPPCRRPGPNDGAPF